MSKVFITKVCFASRTKTSASTFWAHWTTIWWSHHSRNNRKKPFQIKTISLYAKKLSANVYIANVTRFKADERQNNEIKIVNWYFVKICDSCTSIDLQLKYMMSSVAHNNTHFSPKHRFNNDCSIFNCFGCLKVTCFCLFFIFTGKKWLGKYVYVHLFYQTNKENRNMTAWFFPPTTTIFGE
jgi:hypothetical protein